LVWYNRTFFHLDLKQFNNVVECLRELCASKGFRNALKRLDYNAIKLLRMDFLLPTFNGNVVFELHPMESFVGNLQAKLMMGMDKPHNKYD
jgi:hypothetical protein